MAACLQNPLMGVDAHVFPAALQVAVVEQENFHAKKRKNTESVALTFSTLRCVPSGARRGRRPPEGCRGCIQVTSVVARASDRCRPASDGSAALREWQKPPSESPVRSNKTATPRRSGDACHRETKSAVLAFPANLPVPLCPVEFPLWPAAVAAVSASDESARGFRGYVRQPPGWQRLWQPGEFGLDSSLCGRNMPLPRPLRDA